MGPHQHQRQRSRCLDRVLCRVGFEPFIPSIPYLDLQQSPASPLSTTVSSALGLPDGATGRACILQLDEGLPKLDLTEFSALPQRPPLANQDLGLVRLCLVSRDLAADYQRLVAAGIAFVTPPQTCHERLAKVAVCRDPDGTLIELLEVDLARWAPFVRSTADG